MDFYPTHQYILTIFVKYGTFFQKKKVIQEEGGIKYEGY